MLSINEFGSEMIDNFLRFAEFLRKEYQIELQKQAPPGPPPRPGLIWKPYTHRWVRSDIETPVWDYSDAIERAKIEAQSRGKKIYVSNIPGRGFKVSNLFPQGGQSMDIVYSSGKRKSLRGSFGGYYS